MSERPIYGHAIELNENMVDFEETTVIPIGILGFLNLSDSITPKFVRLNFDSQIVWAYEFPESQDIEILHSELPNFKLINRNNQFPSLIIVTLSKELYIWIVNTISNLCA